MKKVFVLLVFASLLGCNTEGEPYDAPDTAYVPERIRPHNIPPQPPKREPAETPERVAEQPAPPKPPVPKFPPVAETPTRVKAGWGLYDDAHPTTVGNCTTLIDETVVTTAIQAINNHLNKRVFTMASCAVANIQVDALPNTFKNWRILGQANYSEGTARLHVNVLQDPNPSGLKRKHGVLVHELLHFYFGGSLMHSEDTDCIFYSHYNPEQTLEACEF